MKKLLIPALFSALFVGCAPTLSDVYTTRQMPITREAIPYNPIIAELEVDVNNKISHTATVRGTFTSTDQVKEVLLWQAMKENGADVIVDPIFEIQRKGGKYVCTVFGYKGIYKNIHKASKEELENLEKYNKVRVTLPETDSDKTTTIFSKGKK